MCEQDEVKLGEFLLSLLHFLFLDFHTSEDIIYIFVHSIFWPNSFFGLCQ